MTLTFRKRYIVYNLMYAYMQKNAAETGIPYLLQSNPPYHVCNLLTNRMSWQFFVFLLRWTEQRLDTLWSCHNLSKQYGKLIFYDFKVLLKIHSVLKSIKRDSTGFFKNKNHLLFYRLRNREYGEQILSLAADRTGFYQNRVGVW